MDNENVPLLNGAVQLLVPEYVPLTSVAAMVPFPRTVIVQDGKAETPPVGTAMVNVRSVPLALPVMFPLKTTEPAGVDAVMVPAMVVPVCVTRHVIRPGPDESDAFPVYVPLRVGAVGVVGVEGDGLVGEEPEPPQAAVAKAIAMLAAEALNQAWRIWDSFSEEKKS